MRRFITYLYECTRGNKTKNVGFVRVSVKEKETTMELCIRNCSQLNEEAAFYLLTYKEALYGVCLGKISLVNGKNDSQFVFETNNIEESQFGLDEVIGIGIRGESGLYIISCWQDAYALEIAQGEFNTQEERNEIDEANVILEKTETVPQKWKEELDEDMQAHHMEASSKVVYEKIDLSQIRDLPSPNWHFATNSFLVHGFWNYGYLVLKKEVEENQEKLSLGVPGIFEKPEAVMAALFGFPAFAEIPPEVRLADGNSNQIQMEKEKNQEAKVGSFGCWFVGLKV